MNMNILSIDTDHRLAMDPATTMGDCQNEAVLWGSQVGQMWIIAFSWRRQNLQVRKISQNVTVYPTSSISHFHMVADALRLGERICRENDIDVITTKDPFLTGLAGFFLKKKLHIPLNIRVHVDCLNNQWWLKERPCNRFFNSLGCFLLNRADSILPIHPSLAAHIKANLKNNRVKLFSLENNGIDVDKFGSADGTSIRLKILEYSGNKIVLFAGRLAKEKNLENLLRAGRLVLKHYPETKFVIVGEGPEEKNLRKMCQTLHIQDAVRFYGPASYDEIPDIMHASNAIVVPSYHEGGGARIIIEALLTRRPVVATDVGGITREIIVNGQNGYVVNPNSPPELADAIIKVLDKTFPNTAGEDFLNHLRQRFDRRRIVPQIVDIWDKTRKLKVRHHE